MDLIVGVIIGTVYGRNARAINQRTYADMCRLASVLSKTQFVIGATYILETVVVAVERRMQPQRYTHDILCECNRRSCRPVSINTYVRKLKGAR